MLLALATHPEDALLDRRRERGHQRRHPLPHLDPVVHRCSPSFGTWLLVRTQFGNWIFAVGGNKEAARAEGVPAARTKTTLFMLVSGAAWLAAC